MGERGPGRRGGGNHKLQNANYKQNYKDIKIQTTGRRQCGVSVVRDAAGGKSTNWQNANYKQNYKDIKIQTTGRRQCGVSVVRDTAGGKSQIARSKLQTRLQRHNKSKWRLAAFKTKDRLDPPLLLRMALRIFSSSSHSPTRVFRIAVVSGSAARSSSRSQYRVSFASFLAMRTRMRKSFLLSDSLASM